MECNELKGSMIQDKILEMVVVISAEEVRYNIFKFVDDSMISEDMVDSILKEVGRKVKEDFGYAKKE